MIISWINTFSLIDFPGKVSCIVFTSGCNMRCGYCHNKEFVLPELLEKNKNNVIPEDAIFNFLEKRKWFLDWVSICWWEPTLHPDLPAFCKKIKGMGYEVKLDTNGTSSKMVQKLIDEKLVDYFAMDIKNSFDQYDSLTWMKNNIEEIKKSKDIIMQSWIDYEFRSTISRGIHTPIVIEKMAQSIEGAKRYFLQNFKGGSTLDECFSGESFTRNELGELQEIVKKYVPSVQVRY